ncbi:hypothetical protein GQ42DRAFT_181851 [Ramicandelaber brevisporus]|nr:hypothetical protein GQ42DRAFT_181851 [Ramicandelaber brevisporus]
MNISKLLDPVPNKKPRFDEDTLVCDKYWLPTELIAYIMTFFHLHFRPTFRLISKKWYTAYDLYLRNKVFDDYDHIIAKPVTRKQLLNAFVKYGHWLRWMFIHTSTLREILDVEPNFADLIPNVIRLYVTIDDSLSSQRWMGDFVAKLSKLKKLIIQEYGFTADDHLADEMDKAVANMPRLDSLFMFDIDLDFNAFPGPNMKERANQILNLRMSVVNIEPGLVASTFKMFKNATGLGFTGISNVDILKEITEMVINEKNFPAMNTLEVQSEFDLSHANPIVNEEDGTTITAMDLYLKIFSIRRPKFELYVGFILGACSKTNSMLIEREREFVIKLGKTCADVLAELELTHYTPSIVWSEFAILEEQLQIFMNALCNNPNAAFQTPGDDQPSPVHCRYNIKKVSSSKVSGSLHKFAIYPTPFIHAFQRHVTDHSALSAHDPTSKADYRLAHTFLLQHAWFQRYNDHGSKCKSEGKLVWYAHGRYSSETESWILESVQPRIVSCVPTLVKCGDEFSWNAQVAHPRIQSTSLRVSLQSNTLPDWLRIEEDSLVGQVPQDATGKASFTVDVLVHGSKSTPVQILPVSFNLTIQS